MKVKHQGTMQGAEKEFLDLFQKLCYSRSGWEVWSDLMSVMACSISNAVDIIPEHHEAREREYEACIKRLGSVEIPAQMLGIIVMALENNPDQDFLGNRRGTVPTRRRVSGVMVYTHILFPGVDMQKNVPCHGHDDRCDCRI